MQEISTAEMLKQVNTNMSIIIDVRPIEAYNGWKLKAEQRGGHIKNAKSFPRKWFDYEDWMKIAKSKNILPENNIIIYGYQKEECVNIAQMFCEVGYENVYIYSAFISEWVSDFNFPMEKLQRYKKLVSADWLNELISGNIPDNYENNKFIVCHSHYRMREAYLSGHIPGAIDMDTLALESPDTWNKRSPEELKEAFENHGITSDTTVILYGKFMFPNSDDNFPGSATGHLGAIRTAMIMIYAGVKDVRVLNGGFQSWIDAEYEIENDDVEKKKVGNFGVQIPAKPEIIVSIDKAKEMIIAKDADIVCVRSWLEYIGEISGYNYIEKKGRIPGAIFCNCGSDAYHMENYRNIDHTIKEASEVKKIWFNLGITPDKHLAFYCGTGWRGSEAFFSAWLMGWPRVSVFDGGWFEWSNNPYNLCETGIPK